MRYPKLIAGFFFLALLGIGVGESSDPTLKVAELPADVINDCAALTVGTAAMPCADSAYRIRWFSRTPRGHLFLVEHGHCERAGCRSWLVEKDARAAHTLLAMTGEFQLERAASAYPLVQTRTALASHYTSYNRYTWSGERYNRSETRLSHRVDNFECGTERECEAAAQQALERKDADRAVKIWQQVHNVDWI